MWPRLISILRARRFAFALAALLALAMVLTSEASYREAQKSLVALQSRSAAYSAVQSLWRNLSEAESAERGYLLTGRQEYLQVYQRGVQEVGESLDWLRAYRGRDVGIGEARELNRLSVEKLSEMSTLLQLYQQQASNGAWLELMLTNIGKEKMDAVRLHSNQLLAMESTEIAHARSRVQRTLLLNRIGIAAMVVLSLLALYMVLRQSMALGRQRAKEHDLVQAERDRLELEVAARIGQLKELAQHLQSIREDERSHLARELHDDLGALLTAAKLDAARLKLRLGTMTPEVSDRLAHLNEALNSGIALKRRIIEDLWPSSLTNLGLVAALEILLREFGRDAEIETHAELHPVRLSPSSQLTVYRLVQEALTNISKYAQASVVHVTLGCSEGQVLVSVRDDGVGFDIDAPHATSHGLLGMRYRLDAAGGQLKLVTAPGQGTLIEGWLPEPPTAESSAGGTAQGPTVAKELLPSGT